MSDKSKTKTCPAHEAQHLEYKENWHDDYLKWVCGFANANGGRIQIGKE